MYLNRIVVWRTCFARFPNTKSMASMTFDFPLPFGPIMEDRFCSSMCCKQHVKQSCSGSQARFGGWMSNLTGRTLWNGPMCCTPAYDLKFSSSRRWITRRGLPSPGEAFISVVPFCCRRTISRQQVTSNVITVGRDLQECYQAGALLGPPWCDSVAW